MLKQVFRVEGRRKLDAGLVRHVRGEVRPAEALGRPEWDGRSAVAIYNGARKPRRWWPRHRPSSEGVRREFPGVMRCLRVRRLSRAKNRWSQERTLEWASDTFDWLRDQLARATPGQRPAIHSAVLHLDERSAHLHTIFAPIIYDGQGPKLSWKRLQSDMAGGESTYGPRQMRVLQDSLYESVSKSYGLERGERGSRRPHADPDRMMGLRDRLADTQARLKESEEARGSADAGRTEAEAALLDRLRRDREGQSARAAEAAAERAVSAAARIRLRKRERRHAEAMAGEQARHGGRATEGAGRDKEKPVRGDGPGRTGEGDRPNGTEALRRAGRSAGVGAGGG